MANNKTTYKLTHTHSHSQIHTHSFSHISNKYEQANRQIIHIQTNTRVDEEPGAFCSYAHLYATKIMMKSIAIDPITFWDVFIDLAH